MLLEKRDIHHIMDLAGFWQLQAISDCPYSSYYLVWSTVPQRELLTETFFHRLLHERLELYT